MPVNPLAALPPELLEACLRAAGAWPVQGHGTQGPWCVCRTWRDTQWQSLCWPEHLAGLMVDLLGPDEALQRAACRCGGSIMVAMPALLEQILRHAWADEGVLVEAAERGSVDGVRALLHAPELSHVTAADPDAGQALVLAAQGGHVEVVRALLQKWGPQGVPPAAAAAAQGRGYSDSDGVLMAAVPRSYNGPLPPARYDIYVVHSPTEAAELALTLAASRGHAAAVRALLQHAPAAGYALRADCADAEALMFAAAAGHARVVWALLQAPEHAPRADSRHGEALMQAAAGGHVGVVQALLQAPTHAPCADCHDGRALIFAATRGHLEVVGALLSAPEHAPRADCRNGEALVRAARAGHAAVVRLLLEWPAHAPRHHCQNWRAWSDALPGYEGSGCRRPGHSEVLQVLWCQAVADVLQASWAARLQVVAECLLYCVGVALGLYLLCTSCALLGIFVVLSGAVVGLAVLALVACWCFVAVAGGALVALGSAAALSTSAAVVLAGLAGLEVLWSVRAGVKRCRKLLQSPL